LPEDEEVLFELPEGYVPKLSAPDSHKVVARSIKAQHGLKQSGRVRNQHQHKCLLEQGFVQCEVAPCIYVKETDCGYVLCGIFVDDIFFINVSNDEDALGKVVRFEVATTATSTQVATTRISTQAATSSSTTTSKSTSTITSMTTTTIEVCSTAVFVIGANSNHYNGEYQQDDYPATVGLVAANQEKPVYSNEHGMYLYYYDDWSLGYWRIGDSWTSNSFSVGVCCNRPCPYTADIASFWGVSSILPLQDVPSTTTNTTTTRNTTTTTSSNPSTSTQTTTTNSTTTSNSSTGCWT